MPRVYTTYGKKDYIVRNGDARAGDEDMTQTIYFFHQRRPVEVYLNFKRTEHRLRKSCKVHLFFDKNITWRMHTDMIRA
jgi:hypothetical protein